jgi:hypothetical protein
MKEMFNSSKKRHPSMDETYVVKSSPDIVMPELPNFLTPSLQRFGRKQQEDELSHVPKMESLGLSPPGAPQMSSSREGLAIPESPKLIACRSGPGVSFSFNQVHLNPGIPCVMATSYRYNRLIDNDHSLTISASVWSSVYAVWQY